MTSVPYLSASTPAAGCWAPGPRQPELDAFHVERVVDPFTLKPCVGMVRHAGHAFVIPIGDSGFQITNEITREFGRCYLDALTKALRFSAGDPEWIHADVWNALKQPRAAGAIRFDWLNVNWGDPSVASQAVDRNGTLGSFWVNRADDVGRSGKAQQPAAPRLLVLLAGAVAPPSLQTGTDMGLRIVMQVHPREVRFYGMTLNGLSHDRVLKAVPEKWPQDADIYGLVRRVKEEIGNALQVEGRLWITNLEVSRTSGAPTNRLSATGFALRWRKAVQAGAASRVSKKDQTEEDTPTRARAYDFRVDVDVDYAAGDVHVAHVHRDAYVGSGAKANARAAPEGLQKAFLQDPTSQISALALRSRRSSQTDKALASYQTGIGIGLTLERALQVMGAKEPLFEIRTARGGDGNLRGGYTVARTVGGIAKVSPAARDSSQSPHDAVVRSDEQASIEAQVRAWDLFLRLQRYGIDVNWYFRFACLPLVQRARPAMRWAPDGELPNAEVRPFLGDPDANNIREVIQPSDRLQLLVKYGSADPMHRRKLPLLGVEGQTGRLKAQYLSVACDPRWAWHEFGHVLNFASTGELEFPFAHSAGDALAAIASDPLSALAAGPDPEAAIRFVTFPWIEVPGRSHGREAVGGYGWCGCRNLVRLDFAATLERYHHSYFGEQLLSSSLFRLYRCLGGDTRGDKKTQKTDQDTRLAASDYCIYLIIRAISLLGPDTIAPARTPDQFVSALIEADLGTSAWNVQAVWPFDQKAPRKIVRQGGRVHKVIRWAFEQQGLYATPAPQATAESKGLPPLVDVYIADCSRTDGGYAPVALRASGPQPAWHAHDDWLARKDKKLSIKVANCGQKTANGLGLRVWWAKVPTTADGPLQWNSVAQSVRARMRSIETGKATTFEVQLPSAAGKKPLWIFASADALADPSNVPVDGPPQTMPELMELVAHDNNLALALR
jgi:hypothetical protein